MKEGVDDKNIFVTGNTIIDTLNIVVDMVSGKPTLVKGLPEYLMSGRHKKPIVLITGHRKESHGQCFIDICNAISILAKRFNETAFVYTVHLNPNVREQVFRLLSGIDNVHLIEPLSYLPFVALINRAKLIMTDYGGIKEEAPSIGKPVLVMREITERPEAVDAGTVKLVGTDRRKIIDNVSALMIDESASNGMANAINPYGDGKTCARIITDCLQFSNKNEGCK